MVSNSLSRSRLARSIGNYPTQPAIANQVQTATETTQSNSLVLNRRFDLPFECAHALLGAPVMFKVADVFRRAYPNSSRMVRVKSTRGYRVLWNPRWELELAAGIGLCCFGRSAIGALGSLISFSIALRCVRDLRVALRLHVGVCPQSRLFCASTPRAIPREFTRESALWKPAPDDLSNAERNSGSRIHLRSEPSPARPSHSLSASAPAPRSSVWSTPFC